MSKREIHEQEHNPDEQVNVQESPADTPEMEENLPDLEAEADGEDEAFDVDGSDEDEAFDEDDVYYEETDSYDEDDTLYMSLDEEEKPQVKTKAPKKKKQAGKKAVDLSGLPIRRIDHYMSADELAAEFGENGWKQLPDAISRCYKFIPAKVEVEEHHIGVYSSKTDEHMVKAPHPRNLLHGSLVSPSLGAAIMNGKYVNAVPLYRLEIEFERYGLAITRQNMANWMIRLGERYLGIMYDYLHKLLYDYHVIQADETPVLVNKDGRPAGSKSWMWVYRSGFMYQDHQIILYEYVYDTLELPKKSVRIP